MTETQAIKAPTLGTIVVEVRDVETLDQCRDWYTSLGLRKMDFDQPGESYWFDIGGDVLLGVHTGAVSSPAGFTIYLNVDDVDAVYKALSNRGFKFESEPETKFWGRSVQLRDPAGTAVRLVTPT